MPEATEIFELDCVLTTEDINNLNSNTGFKLEDYIQEEKDKLVKGKYHKMF